MQIAPRYREASSALKEVILDEFVTATGYARKYAIRLLNHPVDLKLTIERPRSPHYRSAVQKANFQHAVKPGAASESQEGSSPLRHPRPTFIDELF